MRLQLYKASNHFIHVKEKLNRKIDSKKKQEEKKQQIEKENNKFLFDNDENINEETYLKSLMKFI